MKALNPSTGNLEEVYVKALDSMPVGAEIDFTGADSDIPLGWEKVNDYSTSEVNTGKTWIDSKPIYRKVITGTTSSSGNSTEISLNFETIVSLTGGLISNNVFNPCGAYFASDNYVNCYAYNNLVAINNSSNYKSKNYYLIVEYTKTTD